jgi:molybdopterin converting factor small subunit
MIEISVGFTILSQALGCEELEFSVEEHTTVREILKLIHDKLGKVFEEIVFSPEGRIYPHIILMVNGDILRKNEELEREVSEDTSVIFMMPISGG